jgi:hypothetical protein
MEIGLILIAEYVNIVFENTDLIYGDILVLLKHEWFGRIHVLLNIFYCLTIWLHHVIASVIVGWDDIVFVLYHRNRDGIFILEMGREIISLL